MEGRPLSLNKWRGGLIAATSLVVMLLVAGQFLGAGRVEPLRGGFGGQSKLMDGTIYKVAPSGGILRIDAQDVVTGETRLVLSEPLNGFGTMSPSDHFSDGWYVYGLIRRAPAVAPKAGVGSVVVPTTSGWFKPPEGGSGAPDIRRTIIRFPAPPVGDVVRWRRAPLKGGASEEIPIRS